MTTNYWPIQKTSLVTFRRQHAHGYDPANPLGYDHGPVAYCDADLSTSQGTMTIIGLRLAGGEYDGCPAVSRGGKLYAQTENDFWNGYELTATGLRKIE